MLLEGSVEDIIFRNQSNGYTVALLSHGNNLETVVGKMLDVKIGQCVRLHGEYVSNNKYGQQFAFDDCTIVEPQTNEAIEKYLASGLIAGVGEITAHKIVEAFGKDTLSVLEFSPEKLATVRGISKHKAELICQNYGEIKKLERVVMFLQKYEITTNMSLKIYDVYGERTIDTLQQNPYKLVEDVDGIGFLSADKIAASMGVDKNSDFRIRAGIIHVLHEACEKSGHTFLPKQNMIDTTKKLLDFDAEQPNERFEEVLRTLLFDRIVTMLSQPFGEAVMLTKYYQTELNVAKKLAFLTMSSKSEKINVESEINHFEQVNKISFHDDQKNAIASAVENGVCIITGGPGTGKTTIIKCILSILKSMQKNILMVAPTGRAAKRLQESTGEDAKTIHRALEVEHSFGKIGFKFCERNPLPYDVIIVDELSMVDVILANSLCRALPRDCKLIVVGDKDQLPSVGAGNVLADMISSERICTCKLTKIFRQDQNSLIVSNAHLINNGEMPVLDNTSKDFFYENKDIPVQMCESVVELVSKRLPKFSNLPCSKIQVLSALKAGACGVENLNGKLQFALNPPSISRPEIMVGQTTFRLFDKVMQTSNNYDMAWQKSGDGCFEEGLGVFNGDIGTIQKIDYQSGECVVAFEDGKIATYSRVDLPQLSLAYAITIHKSQGCEFDIVVLPVVAGASLIMTRNLLYTAVTRAKKMVVLIGDKKNIFRMVHNKFTAKRYTMLKTFLTKECDKMEEIYG